jgi:hypothetical protein
VASTSSHSIDLEERAELRAGCVVDENLDIVELGDQLLPGRGLTNVVLERLGADLAGNAPCALDVDVCNRDAVAVGLEPSRDRLADPTGGSRDDRRATHGVRPVGSDPASISPCAGV